MTKSVDEIRDLTTQDKLLICIMELQKTAPAYTPFPLIQHIPHLINYVKEEEANAHEFLIAGINCNVSEATTNLFQGRTISAVKCSLCERTTTRSDNMQDFSL